MDPAQIEQMNKVRASLGMAPLPVPGAASGPQFKSKAASDSESEDDLSTLDKRQAAAGGNWERLEEERKEQLARQKRKEQAKKARDLAQKYARLEGKGLGDADEGEELDTASWLRQQKKRQRKVDKERARRMEEELAAREQVEYTSRDLAGVKVGHEMAEFDDATGEQILTLKDAEIGDESEDDELENADLKAKEKLEERLKLKKNKPVYDPLQDEADGEKKAVLSKYDEEIDGKKAKRFTLDGQGNTVSAETRALDADGEVKRKGVKVNLDMLKDDVPVSDYLDPSTVKVKKPKKSKKEKKTRQKVEDDDDVFAALPEAKPDTTAMEVDAPAETSAPTTSRKRALEIDDDEDLQASLAQQRRGALKKRKKMDAAELARQMREEMAVDEEQEQEDGGLTIDETSEFVANLKKPEAPEMRQRDAKSRTPQPASAESPDSEEDVDGDTAMANGPYAAVEEHISRKRETSTPAADATETGLEREDDLAGAGLGAALHLLRGRNLVDSSNDSAHLTAHERHRQAFLASKSSLIAEYDRKAREARERDRVGGVFNNMSHKEREAYSQRQNEAREKYVNSLVADLFAKEYKPSFEIRYQDEEGRSLGQKEAFKHLSHRFHGKGSGKGKSEQHQKRVEDEKREMRKSLLGGGGEEGGLGFVQGREGKKQKSAGVRLQ